MKGDGRGEFAAGEDGALDGAIVVEHVGQGTCAQTPYALPDAVRGVQGGEAAGGDAVYAVDGHENFAYPDGAVGGERHGVGFVWRDALGVFVQDAQGDGAELA